jgi:hypothetical protein
MCENTITNKNHVGKYCNNPQYFKEKNYKTKSTNTILKKKEKNS